MLTAIRQSDGKTVFAYFEFKRNGPFLCLDCGEEVALKAGRQNINHFAHVNPLACRASPNESDLHRQCKKVIYESLIGEPNVKAPSLERSFGNVRPDVSAVINGVPVAIEVQISSLSLATILRRTIEYHRKGMYVLWLLQWTPKLNERRYAPKLWEKWIHTAYFGRLYYWIEGLNVMSYRFEPSLKHIPKATIYGRRNKLKVIGGYTRRSTRFRTAVQRGSFHIVRDFVPRKRFWWQGGGLTVPDGKLFMDPE